MAKARRVKIRIASHDEVLEFGKAHQDSAPTKDGIRKFLKEHRIRMPADLMLNLRVKPEGAGEYEFSFNTSAYVPIRNEKRRKTKEWGVRSTGWNDDYCEWFGKFARLARYYLKVVSSPTVLTYEDGRVTVERVLTSSARHLGLEYKIEKIE